MSRRRHGRRGQGAPVSTPAPVAGLPRIVEQPDSFLDKLGVRPGMTIGLMNPPEGFYSRISSGIPSTVRLYLGLPPKPPANVFLLWPDGTPQNLETSLQYLKAMLSPDGAIWVVIAKKSPRQGEQGQGGQRPLTFDEVQQAGLKVGLVDNKQLSFSDTHYGVRFVIRRADREQGPPGRPPAGADQR